VHPFRLTPRIEQASRNIDILGIRPHEGATPAVLADEQVLGDGAGFRGR
jgi:hypothetical protein